MDTVLQEFEQFVTALADECNCIFHHVMKSGSQLIASLKEIDREEFYSFQMSEYEFQDETVCNQFKTDMINKIEAIRIGNAE